MRKLNLDNLPHQATLQREVKIRQPGGVYVHNGWNSIATVSCRMQPVVKSYRTIVESIRADQIDDHGYYLVITAHDFYLPQPSTDRFRVRSFLPNGTLEWEKFVEILGTTSPHTANAMAKFVCRDFQE